MSFRSLIAGSEHPVHALVNLTGNLFHLRQQLLSPVNDQPNGVDGFAFRFEPKIQRLEVLVHVPTLVTPYLETYFERLCNRHAGARPGPNDE